MPWMEHCALRVHQDSVWEVGDLGVPEISVGDDSSREHRGQLGVVALIT